MRWKDVCSCFKNISIFIYISGNLSQVFFMGRNDYLKICGVENGKNIETLTNLECNFIISYDLRNFIYRFRKLIKEN